MATAQADRSFVEHLGARVLGVLRYVGGLTLLGGAALRWTGRAMVRREGRSTGWSLAAQLVRVGTRSLGIVVLVQLFIGVILALQMDPPLREPFGQEGMIPNIIGEGGFRMLGPIITAVVITGFAGASIAAELGTMVVSEEIEAMEAMGLNPVRFLVVPRVWGTLVAMLLLTVVADWMIALGGYVTALAALGPTVYEGYWQRMQEQLVMRDFVTGLIQAGVFGLLISLIACYEGLKVRGGAEGVGRATTMTVVYSIVAIIVAACAFTMVFYVYEL